MLKQRKQMKRKTLLDRFSFNWIGRIMETVTGVCVCVS